MSASSLSWTCLLIAIGIAIGYALRSMKASRRARLATSTENAARMRALTEKISKPECARNLLAAGNIFVNFDPRREGVKVPEGLRRGPRLVLEYGTTLPRPIPDLEIGADGISATLEFPEGSHRTFVPWTAVFTIVNADKRGLCWEGDVPPDLGPGESPI